MREPVWHAGQTTRAIERLWAVIPRAPSKWAAHTWHYSYGRRPHVVCAYDRRGRDGQAWVRWTGAVKAKRDNREYHPLGFSVRDPRTGGLDAARVRAAKLAVRQLYDKLLVHFKSLDGTRRVSRPRAAIGALQEHPLSSTWTVDRMTVRVRLRGALTLAAGFRIALEPRNGKYASIESRRYNDMWTFARRLFGEPGGEPALIDPTMQWTSFDDRVVRQLQRAMAERYIASGGKRFGVRIAEVLVDAIYSVASWLRSEGYIPATAAVPAEHWRGHLRSEWAQQTGQRRSRCGQPRHTGREYRQIFSTLADPRIDPRIALAIELAAELRVGQVLRCTRRMLALPFVEPKLYDDLPASALGWIDVPDNGRKRGETVMFTPEQRCAVDRALAGFLSRYEAAWQKGIVGDYLLFPSARMRHRDSTGHGREPLVVSANVRPWGRTRARRAFHDLERIAGVKVVKGRGWYGLRRVAADLAEELTPDARVKNALGGWVDSETRVRIYQDHQSKIVRVIAADVRRRMRVGKGMVRTTPAMTMSPVGLVSTMSNSPVTPNAPRTEGTPMLHRPHDGEATR